MSSGVEADIALDAALVLSLGTNRLLGAAGKLTAAGANALAAIAAGRAEALAAARAEAERHERAVRAVLDRNARIAALGADVDRHRAPVAVPVPLDPASAPADELASWAARIEPVLTAAESALTRHIAATAVGAIFGVPAAALQADLAPSPRSAAGARTAAPAGYADIDQESARSGVRPGSTGPAGDGPGSPATARSGVRPGSTGSAPGGPGSPATARSGVRPVPAGSAGPGDGRGAGSPARPDVDGSGLRGEDAERAGALMRVMGRLGADVSAADWALVVEAARRVAEARTGSEAEGLLTEVRVRVRAANGRAAERRTAAERERAAAEAAEQAAAERAYLMDAVTGAFSDLGYDVQEGFETLTAKDGTLLLSKPAWPDHAIKMRVEEGAAQIRAALVRTADPASEEDRRLDVEREEEWCTAFEAARRTLQERAGVRSLVRWRIDPGEHRLPVAPEARQTRSHDGHDDEIAREREVR